jgi:hypothetical protein
LNPSITLPLKPKIISSHLLLTRFWEIEAKIEQQQNHRFWENKVCLIMIWWVMMVNGVRMVNNNKTIDSIKQISENQNLNPFIFEVF